MLYHELVHVNQDTMLRPHQAYGLLYGPQIPGERMRIIGSFEQEAYLKEVLIWDALTEGQLKDSITGKVDRNKLLRQLGARPHQWDTIAQIIGTARKIYETETTLRNFHPDYANFINKKYYRARYDVFDLTPEGASFPLSPNPIFSSFVRF